MEISGYTELIEQIINDLDFKDESIKEEIRKSLQGLNDSSRNELMSSKMLTTLRHKLREKDQELVLALKEIEASIKNPRLLDRIEHLKKELGKLQGLVFLRKIRKDCDQIAKNLIKAYTNKLQVVNQVLAQNLDHSFTVNHKCFDLDMEEIMLRICLDISGDSNSPDNLKEKAIDHLTFALIEHCHNKL